MTKRFWAVFLVLCLTVSLLAGCSSSKGPTAGIDFAKVDYDKDFASLRTPGSQEEAYDYQLFFLPEKDAFPFSVRKGQFHSDA